MQTGNTSNYPYLFRAIGVSENYIRIIKKILHSNKFGYAYTIRKNEIGEQYVLIYLVFNHNPPKWLISGLLGAEYIGDSFNSDESAIELMLYYGDRWDDNTVSNFSLY